MVTTGTSSKGTLSGSSSRGSAMSSGHVSLSGGRISGRRYSRGGGVVVENAVPEVERGRAFTAHNLFSWGSRYNSDVEPTGRKKLKIPMRAFGPSLAEARDSRNGVRERFKNYFAFPKENKVVWRNDGDEIRRSRFWFTTVVGAAVLYTLVHLVG